jgi:hypothetical protein
MEILSTRSVSELATMGFTPAGFTTDGPNGHHNDNSYRDYGFTKVYTQTHDPVMGMKFQSPQPPPTAIHSEFMPHCDFTKSSSTFNQHTCFPSGKLLKMNFPKFEGENPSLWKSRCENYFEMYLVDSCMWVKIATMHFEGPAARWLQSIDHRVQTTSWVELCS